MVAPTLLDRTLVVTVLPTGYLACEVLSADHGTVLASYRGIVWSQVLTILHDAGRPIDGNAHLVGQVRMFVRVADAYPRCPHEENSQTGRDLVYRRCVRDAGHDGPHEHGPWCDR